MTLSTTRSVQRITRISELVSALITLDTVQRITRINELVSVTN